MGAVGPHIRVWTTDGAEASITLSAFDLIFRRETTPAHRQPTPDGNRSSGKLPIRCVFVSRRNRLRTSRVLISLRSASVSDGIPFLEFWYDPTRKDIDPFISEMVSRGALLESLPWWRILESKFQSSLGRDFGRPVRVTRRTPKSGLSWEFWDFVWFLTGVGFLSYGKKDLQRVHELYTRYGTTKWFVVLWFLPVYPIGSYTVVARARTWFRPSLARLAGNGDEIVSEVSRSFDRDQVKRTIFKAGMIPVIILLVDGVIVALVNRLLPD